MLPELTLHEPRMIAITGAVALVAGVVRGFSGFGGPALMALVLTQFFSPLSVLTKVVIIDAVSYLLLVPSTVREFERRLVAVVTTATFLGLPFGVYLLTMSDPVVMKRAVAAAVAACVVVMLLGVRFQARPPIVVQVLVGVLAGVVLGATYIALVAVIFFFALPGSGAQGRANAVCWGVVLSFALIATHMALDNTTLDDLWRAAFVGLAYLAGTGIGVRLFRSTGERTFRRAVLWLLLGLAVVGLVA